ncbi:MAG: TlpA family protein disulfide reductase [Chlorobiaceae bacterium]|nr:TlpA family protein disulfide reductase [Chlorobiaceae bacterium]
MKKITSSLAVICLTVILFATNLMASENSTVALPAPAPSFSGVTIDGKPFSSASLKGKAYIVNFFATWCPPCRAEIPDMVTLQKAYAAKGFTFIGIAVNEKEPKVRKFIKDKGITYPVLMVTPAIVGTFNRYIEGGITGIPTSFVVDSSGNMTGVMVGPRSKAAFEQIINSSTSRKTGK